MMESQSNKHSKSNHGRSSYPPGKTGQIDPSEIPGQIAGDYQQFSVSRRLLFSGHSHQAWPDRALQGQMQAFFDAAHHVDKKWELAFEKADRLRTHFADLLGDSSGDYALGGSAHELLIRFLSALPLQSRPKIVTTDGEFHSARRQLDRLGEQGVQLLKVHCEPSQQVVEKLCREIDSKTSAVVVSWVSFLNGEIIGNLNQLAQVCQKHGVLLLVDAYHAINVIETDIVQHALESAFIVGGGYKYCQFGEGNCFLRIPADCALRPVVTGWFAEFGALDGVQSKQTMYGSGHWRFAGSTYDPTSHYRATEVIGYFQEKNLTPPILRSLSQYQIGRMAARFDFQDLDPALLRRDTTVPLSRIAGFLTMVSPYAQELCAELNRRGLYCDSRQDRLRLGPAPYIVDRQIDDAIETVAGVAKSFRPRNA